MVFDSRDMQNRTETANERVNELIVLSSVIHDKEEVCFFIIGSKKRSRKKIKADHTALKPSPYGRKQDWICLDSCCVRSRWALAEYAKTAFRPKASSAMLMTRETVTTALADNRFTTLRGTSLCVVRAIQQLDLAAVPIIARGKRLERHAGPISCAKAGSVLVVFAKTVFWFRSFTWRMGKRQRRICDKTNAQKLRGSSCAFCGKSVGLIPHR
jgi:hypothetical protein